MTRDQILLLQLLMGKALDAALTQVRGMTPDQVTAALDTAEGKTADLLEKMREA